MFKSKFALALSCALLMFSSAPKAQAAQVAVIPVEDIVNGAFQIGTYIETILQYIQQGADYVEQLLHTGLLDTIMLINNQIKAIEQEVSNVMGLAAEIANIPNELMSEVTGFANSLIDEVNQIASIGDSFKQYQSMFSEIGQGYATGKLHEFNAHAGRSVPSPQYHPYNRSHQAGGMSMVAASKTMSNAPKDQATLKRIVTNGASAPTITAQNSAAIQAQAMTASAVQKSNSLAATGIMSQAAAQQAQEHRNTVRALAQGANGATAMHENITW